jgi:Leucine-rich repeat (LRR) protein
MNISSGILFLAFTCLSLFTQCNKEPQLELVNISDNTFLSALIEAGVDKDLDGQICTCEAAFVTFLDVSGKQIRDMTGIEKFIYLDTLLCHDNNLITLDLTGNPELKYLDCRYNELTSLDVSENSKLLVLDCRVNELSTLDVSYNPALKYFWCGYNYLSVIDVSQNTSLEGLECAFMFEQMANLDLSNITSLEWLYCASNQLTALDVTNQSDLMELEFGGNQLSTLDLTNNPALERLELSQMPSLGEVCVWTTPFPPARVNLNTSGSPNIFFTTECSK